MNLGLSGPPVIDVPGILGADRAAPRIETFLTALVDNQEIQAPLDLSLVRVVTQARDRITGAAPSDDDSEEPIFEIQHPLDADIQETVKALLAGALSDMERGFETRTIRQTYVIYVEGRPERVQFTLDLTGHRAQMTPPRRRSEYVPDMEGLTAQNMDVNLQLIDRIVDMSTANIGDKDRTIAELRSRCERQEKVEWELRQRIQQYMDGSLRRKMMVDEFERDQKRKDDYAEGFKNLAPSVVAWAMGPQAGQTAALLAALTQAGPGALGAIAGGLPGGPPAMDGSPAATAPASPPANGAASGQIDYAMALDAFAHIDGFVAILEARRDLFKALTELLLSKAPQALTHLHALHQGAVTRRQQAGATPASPPNGNGANMNGQSARRG